MRTNNYGEFSLLLALTKSNYLHSEFSLDPNATQRIESEVFAVDEFQVSCARSADDGRCRAICLRSEMNRFISACLD